MTAQTETYRPEASTFYEDNHAYLRDELRKLDHLLRHRVAALRQEVSGSETAGQHLFISDEEIDSLLNEEASFQPAVTDRVPLGRGRGALQDAINARAVESFRQGVFLPLPRLAQLFGLSDAEVQMILLCLAPELHRKYDRLYAYLQDDIMRKRPSIDLVLDVLFDTDAERWNARALLSPQAPLLNMGLLQVVDDPHSPFGSSGLAQFLKLDPRILSFMLGHHTLDARLDGLVRVHHATMAPDELAVDPATQSALLAFARRYGSDEASSWQTVVHLYGPYGVGKRTLALAVCEALNCSMLCLDAARLPAPVAEAESLLRLAFRESLLLQAPLYIAPADVFLGDGERAAGLRTFLARQVEVYGWFTVLAGEKPWPHRGVFEQILFHSVALPMPEAPVREAAWKQVVGVFPVATVPDDVAGRLADRFRLTPGQIRDAAASLAGQHAVYDNGQAPTFEAFSAACRQQAHHNLGEQATKVDPHYTWNDLVLPDDQLAQLQEMCSQVRHHEQVYHQWGFGRKLAYGKGLSALFTGPPGTGKTMAADVLAHDLHLDLFKIDLAGVVSKYIGETEKNLARVFDEAENSNAILFFDEADALFGKRTEISDAHDRYANIETSYLLQKMEQYTGVVILASNLRENMDNAFLRRLRFIVEFPFPDAANRLRIWQTHFPPEAPVSEEVDYELLAERIQVAGGNIKNIVLNAAFSAASNGCVIGMEHVLQGVRREYEKIGKLWDERGFARPKS